jgi:uncharacterized membrane protein YuzA (DUF378 family)
MPLLNNEAVSLLDKLDGSGIIITFAVFVAVGFAAAYIDMYVISKLETMAGVAPTTY